MLDLFGNHEDRFSHDTTLLSGEKRKHEDVAPSTDVEPKKGRIDGDVSAELVSEIIATVTDPNEMVGPDVIIAWVIRASWWCAP